jgi:DivIVA domain-containing protein
MTPSSGPDQRLTPDAVRGVVFPSGRRGRPGYDEEHVRAFCGQVTTELARLLAERASLSEEVQRLRRRVLGMSSTDQVQGGRHHDPHIQAVKILARAQRIADQYVLDAEENCRQLSQDARRRRDKILADARSRAALVLADAYRARQAAARDPAALRASEPAGCDPAANQSDAAAAGSGR